MQTKTNLSGLGMDRSFDRRAARLPAARQLVSLVTSAVVASTSVAVV